MWKYVAVVSYVGTDFCGWQRQKTPASGGAPSVQATLEQALSKITGEHPSIVGSGRTDSGVHALAQVAHFVLKEKEWSPRVLMQGLNSLLSRPGPVRIQIRSLKGVPIDFHAQRSATKKQYSYYFQQGPCALPHLEPVSWWIRKSLNIPAMQEAVSILIGEHDFKPFQASGARPGPTVRRILEAEVSFESLSFPGRSLTPDWSGEVGFVRVRVLGTGFLKQMVRGIAGTLLQVGDGRREASCMQTILDSGRRDLVGPTAPARALWLERVWYPPEFEIG
ncbi:MAG: tRNA pseudouridine(38-40) synthase TruA [Bdellovibrionales bacterium GWB1_55_8]|nr:MAG: tRNA pseudouridine(38-40) synthase TruA [Bdellovibrionales bacterium GWB1_55_8]